MLNAIIRLPDDKNLRAAWLRALGIQQTSLPDSTVVCSQHFLHDDIYETESGLRQLRTGAVPSTVQVCMTCLDTDCKMFLMNTNKLDDAYEKLTGYPSDVGSLKQSLCIQCAQRLRNFSKFRDMSLRARSLMMKLVKKHESITTQHINIINSAINHLKNNLVMTTLGPDHCDLHIIELDDEDDEDSQPTSRVSVEDPLNYESSPYMCTVCNKEFGNELAYRVHVMNQHPSTHSAHSGVASLSSKLAIEGAATIEHSEQALTNDGVSGNRVRDNDDRTRINSCVVKLYDIFKCPEEFSALQVSQECDSLNAHTVYEDTQCRAASEDDVAATRNEPAAATLCDMRPCSPAASSQARTFTCADCQRVFTRRDRLVAHLRTHTGGKLKLFCEYKSNTSNHLNGYMGVHTGEKDLSCELREYKSAHKRHFHTHFVRHIRTHTGEKPYSCTSCKYKCSESRDLVRHMRTHTGEKPFSCKLCEFKCFNKSSLTRHMRIHTGEKIFYCLLCDHRSSSSGSLTIHMRTHTIERPYACNLCKYRSVHHSALVDHMRTYTGEKPYSYKLCKYKCARSTHLVQHMRTHSSVKAFSCKLCEYKFALKGNLSRLLRTHTGKKP